MDWNTIITGAADRYLGAFGSLKDYREALAPVLERSDRVQRLLDPSNLPRVTWQEYADLFRGFDNVQASPGRVLRIFGVNDEDRLRQTMEFILHSRTPVDDRIQSASGRQFGESFFSELLCYYRPYQWPVKSLRCVRGLARVSGVFQTSELAEMTYDQYRRFLLPIAEVFRARFETRLGGADLFERYRFLIISRWVFQEGKPAPRKRKTDAWDEFPEDARP